MSASSLDQNVNEIASHSRHSRFVVIGVGCFIAGTLLSMLANNWRTLLDLYVESNLVRYEAMTSELTGPTEYWVFHSDIDAVRDFATTETAITKIEPTTLATLAVLSVTSARDPAVNRLRAHPSVTAIMSTSIPLFCH